MKILFLCRGNVGRSTFAKYIFDKLAPEHSSTSAGTKPSNTGDSLEEMKAVDVIGAMETESIDVSKHRREAVTPEMVEEADVVISMAERETVQDYVLEHPKFVEWIIEDPKGTDLATHIRIKDEVKEKVKALVGSFQ